MSVRKMFFGWLISSTNRTSLKICLMVSDFALCNRLLAVFVIFLNSKFHIFGRTYGIKLSLKVFLGAGP